MAGDKDILVEARELLANAAHGPLELIRYEHGGGRLYREEPRDLVADFYDAGNRELYYRAPELLCALADEVERMRKQEERNSTCAVCSASLLIETSEPPHCIDCLPTDEDRERWEDNED